MWVVLRERSFVRVPSNFPSMHFNVRCFQGTFSTLKCLLEPYDPAIVPCRFPLHPVFRWGRRVAARGESLQDRRVYLRLSINALLPRPRAPILRDGSLNPVIVNFNPCPRNKLREGRADEVVQSVQSGGTHLCLFH